MSSEFKTGIYIGIGIAVGGAVIALAFGVLGKVF